MAKSEAEGGEQVAQGMKARLPSGCRICHGRPFVIDGRGALRCVCPRGQVLRKSDGLRQQEPARASKRSEA